MDLPGRLTPASPSQLSRSPVGRPSQGTNHKALELLAWTKGPLLRSKQRGSPPMTAERIPASDLIGAPTLGLQRGSLP